MRRSGILVMIARILAVAIMSGVLFYQFPGVLLAPMARVASYVGGGVSPWLSRITSSVEEQNVRFEGWISVDMVLHGGEPVAAINAYWQTGGTKYIILGVVVFAAWAAPAGRRRWGALPVALLALICVGAVDLALEMQRAALKVIGYEWLPMLSFADVDLNRETFARLERAYRTLEWAISFLNGGGLFFIGVLAGWVGYALPDWRIRERFHGLMNTEPR
jgi:hypothetical protein